MSKGVAVQKQYTHCIIRKIVDITLQVTFIEIPVYIETTSCDGKFSLVGSKYLCGTRWMRSEEVRLHQFIAKSESFTTLTDGGAYVSHG